MQTSMIILALDQSLVERLGSTRALKYFIAKCADFVDGFKIGKYLIAEGKADKIAEFIRRSCPDKIIFFDNKDYDVDKTLLSLVVALKSRGLTDMFSVLDLIPPTTLERMAEASGDMKLLVLTELNTSSKPQAEINFGVRRVLNAVHPEHSHTPTRAHGIILSWQSFGEVRKTMGVSGEFIFLVPGIRKMHSPEPQGRASTVTPEQVANTLGPNPPPLVFVIGNAITGEKDPFRSAERIRSILIP